jgi:hypothetical protein
VAVFQRQATKPNLLSQTATGLQPERLYTLSYVVSDFDDIAAPKPELPDILLPVALEGAEVIEEGSYVNRWPNSSAPKGQKVSLDTHRILFRALREQVKITFRDWQDDAVPGGSVGQRQVLNFVNLKPYYEK